MIHERGLGLAADCAVAARWYRIAKEKGSDAAATALGLLYLDGRGVSADAATAHNLLVGPAYRGNGFAKAGLLRSGV